MGMTVALVALDLAFAQAVLRFAGTGCGLQADGVLSRESACQGRRARFGESLRPYSGKASFGRWMCSKR
jgi:hypothetical protein